MRVKDIKHENGKCWVLEKSGVFYVMVSGCAGSNSDSAYAELYVAIARCDYLANRQKIKRPACSE